MFHQKVCVTCAASFSQSCPQTEQQHLSLWLCFSLHFKSGYFLQLLLKRRALFSLLRKNSFLYGKTLCESQDWCADICLLYYFEIKVFVACVFQQGRFNRYLWNDPYPSWFRNLLQVVLSVCSRKTSGVFVGVSDVSGRKLKELPVFSYSKRLLIAHSLQICKLSCVHRRFYGQGPKSKIGTYGSCYSTLGGSSVCSANQESTLTCILCRKNLKPCFFPLKCDYGTTGFLNTPWLHCHLHLYCSWSSPYLSVWL